MAAIESPLSGSIDMANNLAPSPSAGGGGGHAPSPHLNPLQFGKSALGRKAGQAVGQDLGEAAGAAIPVLGETGIGEAVGGFAGRMLGGWLGSKI